MVTREQQVEQSAQDFIKDGLVALDYTTDLVVVRDAFPSAEERAEPLTKTTVAAGFNFDDGGRLMELGSSLTQRIYTIEFWTFGVSPNSGRNVANVIRAIIEQNDYRVPLKAIEQTEQPVIDQLIVPETNGISVTRQIAHAPRQWDRFVWTTIVKLEDVYMPSQSLVMDD